MSADPIVQVSAGSRSMPCPVCADVDGEKPDDCDVCLGAHEITYGEYLDWCADRFEARMPSPRVPTTTDAQRKPS